MTKNELKELARLWLKRIPTSEKQKVYINSQKRENRELLTESAKEQNIKRRIQAKQVLSMLIDAKEWQFIDMYGFHDIPLLQATYNIQDTTVALVVPDIKADIDIIKTTMDVNDYYIAMETIFEDETGRWYAMVFEPVFVDEVNDDVKKCEYLLHLTPAVNLESIQVNGFVPKEKDAGLKNPSRVYFFTQDTSYAEMREPIVGMISHDNTRQPDQMYVMIYVSVKKLFRTVPDILFYGDPRTEHGVYTESAIPPECITMTSRPFDILKTEQLDIAK